MFILVLETQLMIYNVCLYFSVTYVPCCTLSSTSKYYLQIRKLTPSYEELAVEEESVTNQAANRGLAEALSCLLIHSAISAVTRRARKYALFVHLAKIEYLSIQCYQCNVRVSSHPNNDISNHDRLLRIDGKYAMLVELSSC